MKRHLVRTWRSLGGPARLRELRRARGMTLEELAGAADVSKGMLSKLENASLRPNPSLDMVEAIAAALGVKREDLLAGSTETNELGEVRPPSASLELYLRDLKTSLANVRRFKRVATHSAPPQTVPQWARFTEWLVLFTGKDPRTRSSRIQAAGKLRPFKRS